MHHAAHPKLIVIALILLLLALAVSTRVGGFLLYSQPQRLPAGGATLPAVTAVRARGAVTDTWGREFDGQTIMVGDRIAALTVAAVKPYWEGSALSPENVTVNFEGELVVTGHYALCCAAPDKGSLVGAEICFDKFDEQSLQRLPHLQHGLAGALFCLRKSEVVQSLFSTREKEGYVTALVNRYTINSYPNGDANTADLVAIQP